MRSSTLIAALAYAERLHWAVFPCTGKVPAIKGGRGCREATTDPATIRRWWSEYPAANIGVAAGALSGFWVHDVDGEEGAASLAGLEAEHGALPPTVEQTTGSGGRHLLFRHDAAHPVRNRAGLRPGLDSRGDGGYIIVAPSLHLNGARYEWRRDRHPLKVSLSLAPVWLLDLAAPPPRPLTGSAVHFRPACSLEIANGKARYACGALRRAAVRVALAPVGQRNTVLNAEAYAVGRFVHEGLIEPQMLADTLAAAAIAAGEDRRKVVSTLTSALRARGI